LLDFETLHKIKIFANWWEDRSGS